MINLFGEENIENDDDHKSFLKQRDEETLYGRVNRLKYLQKIKSDGVLFSGDMELAQTYGEVQYAYVEGFFLSTLVLSQAFIEKLMQSHFELRGIKCRNTFNGMLKYAKENDLFNEYVVRKLDFLRLIRNPITHLKSIEYEYGLGKRSHIAKKHPLEKLEEEATLAISIMIHIVQKGFN